MTPQNSPPRPPASRYFSRWTVPRSSPKRPYRFVFRLIGIPIIAVGAVLIYRGVSDRFFLPQCDSQRAKQTLSEVFDQLKLAPLRYEPIKTVSASKDEIVCNAILPLPDGGSVVVDYTFYWQGDKANMRYSIHREAAKSS